MRLLDEGLAARVIEELEEPGRYQFTHAQIQETLLCEISSTRRVMLHGEIAEALEERYGDRAEERASRLAGHYSESAMLTAEHSTKAIRYSILASEQSESMVAWDAAVGHYERAITTFRGTGEEPDPSMFVALGRTLIDAFSYRPEMRAIYTALTSYEETGNAEGYGRAALELSSMARGVLDTPRQRPVLERAVDGLSGKVSELRARLLVRLAATDQDAARARP